MSRMAEVYERLGGTEEGKKLIEEMDRLLSITFQDAIAIRDEFERMKPPGWLESFSDQMNLLEDRIAALEKAVRRLSLKAEE